MPNAAGDLWGVVGPPAGPVQNPGWGAGGETSEALKILYFTLPKIVKKSTFMGHFFCVLHLKVKGKLIKIKKTVIIFYQILAIPLFLKSDKTGHFWQ